MAYIDSLIDAMERQNFDRLKIVSNQPMVFVKGQFQTNGTAFQSAAVEGMVREIIPSHLLGYMTGDAPFSFPYQAPSGTVFSIQCARRAGTLAFAVTPNTRNAPRPQTGSTGNPKLCIHCGKYYEGLPPFCPNCGKPQKLPAPPPPRQASETPRTNIPKPPTAPPRQASAPPRNNFPNQTASTSALVNDSGTGEQAVLPDELKGFNWGAFYFSLIWCHGNKTPMVTQLIALFLPQPIGGTWLGFQGNKIVWQCRKWDSIDHFKKVQGIWRNWALGFFISSLLLIPFLIADEINNPVGETTSLSTSTEPISDSLQSPPIPESNAGTTNTALSDETKSTLYREAANYIVQQLLKSEIASTPDNKDATFPLYSEAKFQTLQPNTLTIMSTVDCPDRTGATGSWGWLVNFGYNGSQWVITDHRTERMR